jgi:hypothetical protein
VAQRLAWWTSRPLALGLVVWLLLGIIATLLIWQLDSAERNLGSRLRDNGVEALATVTAAEPSNHNNVSYRYVVEGVTYNDTSLGHGPEGGAADLTIGQRIHIVYDSTNPEASCYCVVATLRKPSDWWRTLIAGLFLSFVLSAVLTLGLVRRARQGDAP